MKIIPALILFASLVSTCAGQTARNFRSATFANLGTPTANNVRYCPDCNIGAPCTGEGAGAYAYATGAQWNCTSEAPGGGSGSVTSVSQGNSVSGLTMTISNPTTTPVINLSGTPNIAGTNITSGFVPVARLGSGTPSSLNFLRGDGAWTTGLGTVTSIALALPGIFSVSGSPVTTTGTLTATLANQSANTGFFGPTAGAAAQPGFRALVLADIPLITESKFSFTDITTGNASASAHGLMPKLTGNGSDCVRGDGSISTCPGAGTGGDFSTNTTTSALNQVMVASGAGGKTGQFSTVSGVGIFTAGVLTAKANPSGAFIGDTDSQTLSNKIFTTPTIGSFINANHNHTNSANGGLLSLASFPSNTGSGAIVGQTSPQLITPSLGVATATSINKMVITAPATGSTLTVDNAKTFRVMNTLTFIGTDGANYTFPSPTGTVLTEAASQTVANKTHTLPILGGNLGLPATCTVGQQVRDTSVTPNTYYKCISTDLWGQELVAGTVGAVSAVNGGMGLSSGDAFGTISISGATSGTKTFSTTLSAAPKCVVTPTSDIGAVRYWVTKSTTTLTVTTSASVTTGFDYHCGLIP